MASATKQEVLFPGVRPVDSVHMRAVRAQLQGRAGWTSVGCLSRRTYLRLPRVRKALRQLKASGAVERAQVRGREAWRLTTGGPARHTIDGRPEPLLEARADVLDAIDELGPSTLSQISRHTGRTSAVTRKCLHHLRRVESVACRGKRWQRTDPKTTEAP